MLSASLRSIGRSISILMGMIMGFSHYIQTSIDGVVAKIGSRAVRALAVMAVVAPAMAVSASAENCQLKQLAAFDMEGDVDGAVYVKGKIEDQPVLFNFGLIGNVSSISEVLADKLKFDALKIDQERIFNEKCKNTTKYVTVPNFFIENTKFRGGPFVTMSGTSVEFAVIASDYLDAYEIEIDPANRKIKLFDQDHCRGAVVYWNNDYLDQEFRRSKFGQIIVPVTVDGVKIDAVIDMGSSRSSISTSLVDGHDDQDGKPGTTPKTTVVKYVEFAGIKFNNQEVLMQKFKKIGSINTGSHINTQSLDNFEMIIGMDILSKLHTFISYKEGKLYLTLADVHK